MHHDDHPLLRRARIADLRPTQPCAGLREVAAKRESWKLLKGIEERRFLGDHMVPVVAGPKGRHYILDNHHLVRALHDEGVEHMLLRPVADLSHLGRPEFWRFMDCRNWLRLYDAEGRRCAVEDLPKSVAGLIDDPFRSLAGELRRAGGFAKDMTPYSEFLWADHLRARLKRSLVERDFDAALKRAMDLARAREAAYLPGWSGPET
ncbi:MAG: chromosome partitioning protein ParB [Proteobacteria bacterium]|nr:chromosome partitioning protein ParB [Pseudomonadota bacterium]MBS0571731.1 chromosome partitioning protein ParB [Pseudomonadota bacterium]